MRTKMPNFLVSIPRPDEEFDQLVKEVTDNDLVLRAIIGEAEMLIFSSILLPQRYQSMCSVFLFENVISFGYGHRSRAESLIMFAYIFSISNKTLPMGSIQA